MSDFVMFTALVGMHLSEIDPENLAVREEEEALWDIAAVINGAYHFGMTTEDAALLVLSSEIVLTW